MQKIAIVHANNRVHATVWDLAIGLRNSGFDVDIFLHASDDSLTGSLAASSGLRTFWLDRSQRPCKSEHQPRVDMPLWKRIYRLLPGKVKIGIRRILDRVLLCSLTEYGLVDRRAFTSAVRIAGREHYAVIIGVEKAGLIFAGQLALRLRVPLAYLSLELYTWDHPFVQGSLHMQRLKRFEQKYHKRAAATIIQDARRADVLFQDNGIKNRESVVYLPISAPSHFEAKNSRLLRERLHLSYDQKIILSFGEFSTRRLSDRIAHAAQTFPADWSLVFHGFGSPEIQRTIKEVDRANRVVLSTELVPEDKQADVIFSADIGLALYSKTPTNDRLTGFASQKLAMYLKAGKPVIAFEYESYEHIEAEGAGVLIAHESELVAAIRRILRDYDRFALDARRCYDRYYDFATNTQAVSRLLETL